MTKLKVLSIRGLVSFYSIFALNACNPATSTGAPGGVAAKITYLVTSSGTNVSITPDAAQAVVAGSTQEFSLTPSAGHSLSNSVGGTCPAGTWATNNYTTGPITADCTVIFSAPFTVGLISVAGNLQSQQIGSVLNINPRVQYINDQGQGVAGKVLSFYTSAGDGQIAGQLGSATTDAQGYAEIPYRLGFQNEDFLTVFSLDGLSNPVKFLEKALASGTGAFSTLASPGTGNDPNYITQGDFNGDGKSDLAITNYSDSTVSVFLGIGDGTFHTKVDYATGSNPQQVVTADLKGRGIQDLIVANLNSNTISILFGNGDGTFNAKTDISVGTNPLGVTVSDVNRDGKPDILVTNYYGNTISVLLGNGDGTFTTGTPIIGGCAANDICDPLSIAVADLNGDGKVDMVVGNLYAPSVTVFLGNGDGTFASPVNYGVDPVGGSGGVYSVILTDLRGNGILDVAAANYNTGTVSVLLGNGDGTFASKVNYTVGANPAGVVAGDFRGTGKNDLAIANAGGTTLTLLSGNGDGTFSTTQTTLTAGSGPGGITAADFNGDGKLDLAAPNANDNTMSVFLGN